MRAAFETCRARIGAGCLHSLTVAWSYLLFLVGLAFNAIDWVVAVAGDPDINRQIATLFGDDPKLLGRIVMVIAAVTLLARLRSIILSKA